MREIQETADRNMMKSQTRKPDQRRNGDEALVDEQIDHDVDFIDILSLPLAAAVSIG